MFKAEFISLSGDIYYQNVKIIEDSDIEELNISPELGTQTCIFIADDKILQTHQYNINVIKLDSHQRTSNNKVELLIIVNEMKYSNSYIIPTSDWKKQGIPDYFIKNVSEQIAWSNTEGTFISSTYDVLSIINPKPNRGVQSQINVRPKNTTKQPIPINNILR